VAALRPALLLTQHPSALAPVLDRALPPPPLRDEYGSRSRCSPATPGVIECSLGERYGGSRRDS